MRQRRTTVATDMATATVTVESAGDGVDGGDEAGEVREARETAAGDADERNGSNAMEHDGLQKQVVEHPW